MKTVEVKVELDESKLNDVEALDWDKVVEPLFRDDIEEMAQLLADTSDISVIRGRLVNQTKMYTQARQEIAQLQNEVYTLTCQIQATVDAFAELIVAVDDDESTEIALK